MKLVLRAIKRLESNQANGKGGENVVKGVSKEVVVVMNDWIVCLGSGVRI